MLCIVRAPVLLRGLRSTNVPARTQRALVRQVFGAAVTIALLNRARASTASTHTQHREHQAARTRGMATYVHAASNDLAVVYVTSEEQHAQGLASGLVEAGLAACVNIVPGAHCDLLSCLWHRSLSEKGTVCGPAVQLCALLHI